jgi:NitT/TauT family transport system permease protein
MPPKPTDRRLLSLISLAMLILAWWGASFLVADYELLPPPSVLVKNLYQEMLSGELWLHLSMTLYRVAWAFSLAMVLGVIIGFTMGRYAVVDAVLNVWLVVLLNLPALLLIVLCYIWIGLNETAAIIAVILNKMPLVANMVRQGARELSPKLVDLSRVYDLSVWQKARYIIAPQMFPYIISAARSGLAIIWKIVLVVEFLGRSNGIGFQIHLYFQLFDVAMVMSYAMSFIVIMIAIEYGVMRRLEVRADRWRTP